MSEATIDGIAGQKSGDIWKFIAQGLLVVLMSAGGAFLTVESRISSKIETESPWAKDQAVVLDAVKDVEALERRVNDLRLAATGIPELKQKVSELKLSTSGISDLKKEVSELSNKVTQLQVNGRALKETLDRVRSTEQTVTALQVSNASLNAKLDQLLAKRNEPRTPATPTPPR